MKFTYATERYFFVIENGGSKLQSLENIKGESGTFSPNAINSTGQRPINYYVHLCLMHRTVRLKCFKNHIEL